MKGPIVPHLAFYGNAKESATFYCEVLGLEIKKVQYYKDVNIPHPPEAADFYLHCLLKKGNLELMLADSLEDKKETQNITLVLECESVEEAKHLYEKLGQQGKVIMELQKTFWDSMYAKVTDKFGFTWDINVQLATNS